MILRPLSTSAGTAMSCPGSGDGCSPPTTLAGTRLSCRRRHTHLTLDVDRKSDNAGFEGLARGREKCTDSGAGKKPLRFLETDHSHDSLSVSDSLTHRLSLPWFLKDISGLHYDRKNRRLYVLSHESALVMVSDPEGGWRVMPLRQGHSGLERDIPQAEGIASDGGIRCGWSVSQTGFTASAGQRRHDGLDGLQTEWFANRETKGILSTPGRPYAVALPFHLLWPVCGKTFTFSNSTKPSNT